MSGDQPKRCGSDLFCTVATKHKNELFGLLVWICCLKKLYTKKVIKERKKIQDDIIFQLAVKFLFVVCEVLFRNHGSTRANEDGRIV